MKTDPSGAEPFSNAIIGPACGVLSTQVEDEIILLSSGGESFHGLRGVAVRTWQLIEEDAHPFDDIAGRLTEEFDADAATIRRDLARTLQFLNERTLIRTR